jgi:alpha-L-rhamnosidase
LKKHIYFLLIFCLFSSTVSAQFKIKQVTVEYEKGNSPTIDVKLPRFSWQLVADTGKRAILQTAYAIKIDTGNKTVWESGKISSSDALGIRYAGKPLEPNKQYNYELQVWDNNGKRQTASGNFFTALLDQSEAAWSGAEWIGGNENDLVFYSHYISVYKISYQIQIAEGSGKAAFLFGGNDSRLMDKNLNIQGVQNQKNESFIALELDLQPLNAKDGKAFFHIYRSGYAQTDLMDKPFTSIEIPLSLINNTNKHQSHQLFIEVNFGVFTIYLNGTSSENRITPFNPNAPRFVAQGLNLNPVGVGNNFISYPMLADIGFWIKSGQKAKFSNLEIRNFRSPSNLLFGGFSTESNRIKGMFGNDLEYNSGTYYLEGSSTGKLLMADPSKNGTPMLRTVFKTENKEIKQARLYVTARGIYEIYANAKRIGQDYFNPGLTQYDKHHPYQVYSLDLIQGQENAIGALLAEGWWSGNITYSGENWNYFGDRQSLLAKLVIDYQDGTSQIVTTQPESWKITHDGPIRYGSFFQGEVYDARREALYEGWSTPNFNDQKWQPAEKANLAGSAFMDPTSNPESGEIIRSYDNMKLIFHQGQNPSIVKELYPISVEEVRPGVFVYDMGQNMVGFPKITLKNTKAGEKITLRYAEVRYPDLPEHKGMEGTIMLENIRAALTQDIYITKGGTETIQPRFTFHGYRFLEITGIPQPVPLDQVKGLVISSIDELTANYQTSNPLVNKLWENITWSMRGNFLSIPTDTPARNERMGWSGDINVFSRTATYMADAHLFLKRHLLAMRDIQRPDGRFPDVAPVGGGFGGTLWGSAGITVPWETYLQYGDLELLEEHYPAMEAYMTYLDSKIDAQGILSESSLGDWLSPDNLKNDNSLFWNAYHIRCLEIMSEVASLLNRETAANNYKIAKTQRMELFNRVYINPVSGHTLKLNAATATMLPPSASPSPDTPANTNLIDTQASYAVALDMGSVDESIRPKVLANLIGSIERENKDDEGIIRPPYSLMTGFIGTASIGTALSEGGKHEVMYRLLQQTSYPSWLYSVVNGATTIWERLNSYTVENGFGGNNSMNSFNHYSFGAVGAWMINYSLGITRDEKHPGFKHFVLQPNPDPDGVMTFAKGYYDSNYGKIVSEWKKADGKTHYHFEVPANTTATLILAAEDIRTITEGGKPITKAQGVKLLDQKNGNIIFNLQSGKYYIITP